MLKKILITLACLMCWGVTEVYAVGTQTGVTTKVVGSDVQKTTFTWLADAADASIATATLEVNGWVLFVAVDQGDVTTCANDMDITLLDADGVDVLGGVFVDLQAATTDSQQAAPAIGSAYGARWVTGSVTSTIASCGTNSATGAFIVYWIQ